MKNFLQSGERLDYTNTSGATLTSGTAVLIVSILGVLATDILNTEIGVAVMDGVFSLPKLTTDVVVQGDKLYWDATNKRLTLTATANTYAGYAHAAAGNGITTVECRINR